MQATTLGLKNLERVAAMLLTATTTQPGDPYDELTEVYGRLVAQWTLEMNHVTQLVGGFLSQQKHIGQDGVRFTPVPRRGRRRRSRFLLANAFMTPTFLIKPELLRRMEPAGVMDRVRNAQNSVMNSLLQTERIERLVEQAALDGSAAYRPVQFLADLRRGIWSELATPARPIDPYRRNTQRVYLDTIDNRLNGNAPPDPPKCGRCCAASCARCAHRSSARCRLPPTVRRGCISRTRGTRSTRCSIRAPCGQGAGRGGVALRGLRLGHWRLHPGSSTSPTTRFSAHRMVAG